MPLRREELVFSAKGRFGHLLANLDRAGRRFTAMGTSAHGSAAASQSAAVTMSTSAKRMADAVTAANAKVMASNTAVSGAQTSAGRKAALASTILSRASVARADADARVGASRAALAQKSIASTKAVSNAQNLGRIKATASSNAMVGSLVNETRAQNLNSLATTQNSKTIGYKVSNVKRSVASVAKLAEAESVLAKRTLLSSKQLAAYSASIQGVTSSKVRGIAATFQSVQSHQAESAAKVVGRTSSLGMANALAVEASARRMNVLAISSSQSALIANMASKQISLAATASLANSESFLGKRVLLNTAELGAYSASIQGATSSKLRSTVATFSSVQAHRTSAQVMGSEAAAANLTTKSWGRSTVAANTLRGSVTRLGTSFAFLGKTRAGAAVSGIAEEISRSSGKLGAFNAGVVGASSRLGGFRTGIKSTASVLAVLGAVVAAVGVNFNASFESLTIGFTAMLRSGKQADDLIDRLIKTSAVTPFRVENLANGVRLLLAGGVATERILKDSGKEATGLLINIGDAVAAMGGGQDVFNGVARAMAQIATKGKASAEELRQLAERGIPAYDILREKLGLTGKQVAQIGDYAISADKTIKALSEGFEERFGGAMALQARTFRGVITTLVDNISIFSGAVTKDLFLTLRNSLRSVTDTFLQLNVTAERFGFVKAIQKHVPVAGNLLVTLATTVGDVIDGVKTLGPFVVGLATPFGLLAKSLSVTAGSMSKLGLGTEQLSSAFGKIPDSVLYVTGVFVGLGVATNVVLKLAAVLAATRFGSLCHSFGRTR